MNQRRRLQRVIGSLTAQIRAGPSAQLAFLVFGPMIDLKLGALYVGTFSKGFFRTVLIVVTAVTLVACLWMQVIWG